MAEAGGKPRGRGRYTLVSDRVRDELRRDEDPDAISIVPFVRGRRPTDEAQYPGLGSSDAAAFVLGDPGVRNRAYVLYTLPRAAAAAPVRATLAFAGHDGRGPEVAVPGWEDRALQPVAFAEDGTLRPATARDRRLVLELDPERDLAAPERYAFAELFLQRVRVRLRAEGSVTETALDVCDARRLGSLYARVLERVIRPDTQRQREEAGLRELDPAFHPWFPVLLIGADKAALYVRALVGDVVRKERHLVEPAWLLRVGLYLELLTCIGIADAVRDDVGDLLTEEERAAVASSSFAAVRERLDVDAWREVWASREIAFPHHRVLRAGPVSLLNLLRKRRATLAFLHTHHEDLKRAIELAGPNRSNAQETWQRVFRDAERAVLRQTPRAFPELGYLPRQARHLVLWHRQGRLDGAPGVRVPRAVAALLSDRDGLYASACNQYRDSMNAVARWAGERSLMHLAGAECIPADVSLLEATMNAPERVAVLQRRDGYADGLDVIEPADATEPPVEDVEELLRGVDVFRMLSPDELRSLARRCRPLALGPTERFVVEGTDGSSLFLVGDGEVEVLRRRGGRDVRVGTLRRGAIVGEMSLLTGEPRSATVRAVDGALVYEIGRLQYEPLLRAHREWVDELARVMDDRLRVDGAGAGVGRRDLARRIRRHFFARDDTGRA